MTYIYVNFFESLRYTILVLTKPTGVPNVKIPYVPESQDTDPILRHEHRVLIDRSHTLTETLCTRWFVIISVVHNTQIMYMVWVKRPVTWLAPSHYLNQRWNIVNLAIGNKLQWNFNRNQYIFIGKNAFKIVVCEMAAILSRKGRGN